MKGLTKLLMVLATGTLPLVSTIQAHEFIIKPRCASMPVIKCPLAFFRPTFS